jgi:hypothetical protein
MTWLKLYYRDKEGVMRAIPGMKILPGGMVPAMIYLDESVYTLESYTSPGVHGRWWFDHVDRRDD